MVRRTPVASKIALPIAGASATRGVSPAPADGNILAIEQYGFDLWHVAKARDAITRKTRVRDAAAIERNRFEERAAQAHDVRADNLVAQAIGIHNRATIERSHHAYHAHTAAARRPSATSAQVAT